MSRSSTTLSVRFSLQHFSGTFFVRSEFNRFVPIHSVDQSKYNHSFLFFSVFPYHNFPLSLPLAFSLHCAEVSGLSKRHDFLFAYINNDLIGWKHLLRNGCLILISEVNSNTARNLLQQRCIFNCCVMCKNSEPGIAQNWVELLASRFSFSTRFFFKCKWRTFCRGWNCRPVGFISF